MKESKPTYSLREIRREDLPIVLSWRNSDRIRNLSYNDREISDAEHAEWFESLQKSQDRVCFVFEISGEPVGVVQFFEIDSMSRKCKWGFYLGPEQLPKGLGTVMGTMALQHAFQFFEVDTIYGEAISHNDSSLKFHEKLGFRQDGRIERQIYRDGLWRDVILFSLSKLDWSKQERKMSA